MISEYQKKKIVINPPQPPKPSFLPVFVGTIGSALAGIFSNPKKLAGVMAMVALVSVGAAVFFFIKFIELQQNPNNISDQQVKELVEQVSKLIVLPENEIPTIATVSDPERLKNQPFFTNAKKGYKVLIYTNAKKAILYDPVDNKIIEIASIDLGKPPQ